MIEVSRAIYERLVSDANICALLSIWKHQPAVFTGDIVPTGVELPYIHVQPLEVGVTQDSQGLRGIDGFWDVNVYADLSSSLEQIDAISTAVYNLFSLGDWFEIGGYHNLSQSIRRAIGFSDAQVATRSIQINLNLLETTE